MRLSSPDQTVVLLIIASTLVLQGGPNCPHRCYHGRGSVWFVQMVTSVPTCNPALMDNQLLLLGGRISCEVLFFLESMVTACLGLGHCLSLYLQP